MVRVKNVPVVPFWVLLAAAAVLVALLGQAQPVMAPTSTVLPVTSSAASSAPTSISQPTANAAVQRTIDVSKPNVAAPAQAPAQAAPQAPSAPGSGQCPSQPGSGLPCRQP